MAIHKQKKVQKMDSISFLEALSAGGDLAVMALVVLLWGFDRRILSIENFLKLKLNYGV